MEAPQLALKEEGLKVPSLHTLALLPRVTVPVTEPFDVMQSLFPFPTLMLALWLEDIVMSHELHCACVSAGPSKSMPVTRTIMLCAKVFNFTSLDCTGSSCNGHASDFARVLRIH